MWLDPVFPLHAIDAHYLPHLHMDVLEGNALGNKWVSPCDPTHTDAKGSPFISQIIKEYERAVVFRLGRIRADKAKGPGTETVDICYHHPWELVSLKKTHRKPETCVLGTNILHRAC